MYVCVYVHAHVHVNVCVYACVFILHMHVHMTNPFVDVCTCVHVCAGSLAQPTHIAVADTTPSGTMASALQIQTVLPTGMLPWGDCQNRSTIEEQWQRYIYQAGSNWLLHTHAEQCPKPWQKGCSIRASQQKISPAQGSAKITE